MLDIAISKKPQVYSTLFESEEARNKEPNFSGFLVEKTMELENDIKKFILYKVKNKVDVDDIFQDVLMMLSTKDYYDIPDDVPIKSFIFSRVNIMIKRYFHKKGIDNKMLYFIDDNDKYANIDTCSGIEEDTDKNKVVFTREEVFELLKCLEGRRYKYKYDLYLILYIQLIVNFDDNKFMRALSIVTGGDKKSLQASYSELYKDNEISQVVKMIVNYDDSTTVLEDFIYGADGIKSMLVV